MGTTINAIIEAPEPKIIVSILNTKVEKMNQNGVTAKDIKSYNDIWFEYFKIQCDIKRNNALDGLKKSI